MKQMKNTYLVGFWTGFLALCLATLAAAATNFSILSVINTGFGGGEQRAEVSGKVLCVSGVATQVKFYNLTNPAAPVLIGSVNVPGTTHAIGHYNDYFYLAGDGWLRTFSCPGNAAVLTNSTFTEFLSPVRNGNKMKVQAGYIFLGTYVNGLAAPGEVWIFTLTNPAAPQFVSVAAGPVGSGMSDVAVKNDALYVCGYFNRQIHVFDISNIQTPRLVHTQAATNHGDYAPFEPWRMLIKDDALYVQDDNSWQIFNINTATNPVFVSDLQVERDIEGSRLVGDTLMWGASGVAGGSTGILLYDCRDAFNPQFVCRTNLGSFTGYYWGDMDEGLIYQPQASQLHILSYPPLPSQPVSFSAVNVTPGAIYLSWHAPTSSTFYIEWCDSLSPAVWSRVASPIASGTGMFGFTDDSSQTAPFGPFRFYRLVQP